MKKAKVAGYVLQLSFFVFFLHFFFIFLSSLFSSFCSSFLFLQLSFFVFHLKIHKLNEFFYIIELMSLSFFSQTSF